MPSDAEWDYLNLQVSQVLELRVLQAPRNDRLRYFRMSLELKNLSPTFADMYPCRIYEKIEDIEVLEEQVRNKDYTEFVAQCCAVSEVYLRLRPPFDPYFTRDARITWIYDHARTVADIACLRRRLNFKRKSIHLRELMENLASAAVLRASLTHRPTWQDFVMLLRTTGAIHTQRMMLHLNRCFDSVAKGAPKAALSLLLSYIAEHVPREYLCYSGEISKSVILKLVSSGASLMTSRKDHLVLYKVLENHLRLDRTPWWLEPEEPTNAIQPTALYRLECIEWESNERKRLMTAACCKLDLNQRAAKKFTARNCLDLRCIAARKLQAQNVQKLPQILQRYASRHVAVDEGHDWTMLLT